METESPDSQVDGGFVMGSRAVMALSGGMDSTSLLLRLLRDGHGVTCVSYEYGQKHSIEIEMAKENIQRLQSMGMERLKKTYKKRLQIISVFIILNLFYL